MRREPGDILKFSIGMLKWLHQRIKGESEMVFTMTESQFNLW